MLLPGLQGHGATLRPLAERLAERWTVRVYDLPDAALADALVALRVAVTDRPHLVACGLAGVLACRLEPGAVPSIVGIGAPVGPTPHVPAAMAVARRAGPLLGPPYRLTLRRRLIQDGVPTSIASKVAAASRPPHRRLRWLQARPLPPPPVPALWLRGATDTRAPWTSADVARWAPQAGSATAPGSHRPFASHPQETCNHLESFWSSLPGSAAVSIG